MLSQLLSLASLSGLPIRALRGSADHVVAIAIIRLLPTIPTIFSDAWMITAPGPPVQRLVLGHCMVSILTWGWMFGAVGHQVTNDPTFYDKYPSLSGTSVLPAATTALGYYKITGTQLDTSLLRPILATTTATSTSTRGAGVVEFFSAVKSGAPACVQNMPSVCPGLYSNASECYVRHAVPEPKDCFCVNVWDESCEGICTAREQPALYLRYIKGACSKRYSSSGTPKPPFADYQFYQSLAYKNLFPWTWNVTSQMAGSATVYPKSPNCPSRFAKLGSFAIINLVKLLSLAFLGRRTVVKYLTCKKCGRKGSPWWIFTPLLSTGLSVGITFYNASLVHHTRGYSSTPSAQLALLWLCRPRIAWLAIILGHIQLKKGMYVSLAASTALSEILEQGLTFVYMGRTAHFAHIRGYYLVYQINGVVIPKGRAALIMYSGAILWIVSIGFVILVTIWTFLGLGNLFKTLASRIFGQTKEAPEATRQVARNMGRTFSEYFSAWAANLRASIRQSVHLRVAERMQRNRVMDHLRLSQTLHRALNLVRITQRRIDMPSQQEELQQSSPVELSQEPPFPQHQTNRRALLVTESNWLKEMGLSPRALIKLRFILGWMVFPFIAQWLFWYGFVDLADDLYCPPHIWTLTILWCISALVTPVLQSAV
ncbi:hypothetical protein K469DRAFT_752339 [Zopfia rhizophila CBS 207.26]|uniref:Uncharacterized protein n=1 Tax=Zopfia rhizophila CBS 207.26 TaxID=1314779 RepID=A0A6A6DRP7_9PEZI|nr:hypothetical protein K469DRAFT_752339 [Zopfia rhizophila CBS 207.26]